MGKSRLVAFSAHSAYFGASGSMSLRSTLGPLGWAIAPEASAGGPLSSITTWGISDQYTWIRWAYPRRDGTANRPLPLDWSFNEKPMMAIINEFRNRGA